MNERIALHNTFVVERVYKASPTRVFANWADPKLKEQWFSKADEFDFRVGGAEKSQGGPPGGPVFTFDAQYQDIVQNERIVYSYTLDMDDKRLSISVTTVEFKPEGAGTKLIFTEQGVFLDGHDSPAQREHGTKEMLDKLGILFENS
ncbi:polyketide cyclase [Paenibacillus pectinilyticus]|uniref:Polyketide cyclase n=1 Tax=Paenibacillus pectinilyticus TaxID=512399 RepID=A0A1C0ZXU9_9BACL|nr:SRPBCC family protein [Paenibacillus pectinilyticus]OCT12955.1 polyketide cyclase [Paenibacillus pectinilyticus]